MPFSVQMSAPSSGGVCSNADLTADTMEFNGSVNASKISLDEIVNERGMPSARLVALDFHLAHPEFGNAEPICFFDRFRRGFADQHAVVAADVIDDGLSNLSPPTRTEAE